MKFEAGLDIYSQQTLDIHKLRKKGMSKVVSVRKQIVTGGLNSPLIHPIIHIWRCIMRTNIVLNDLLVKEAFAYAHVNTKKDLIELALSEFVENHRRRDVRELRGHIKLDPTYNYKVLRTEGEQEK